MDSITPIASLHSQVLDLPPSCAQFCPAHPVYLVVGTYELQKDDGAEENDVSASKAQSRNGSLVVLRMEGDQLIKVQTVSQPSALLDLRFYPQSSGGSHRDVLAAVSSTGTVAVFRLDPNAELDEDKDQGKDARTPLKHVATSRCEDLDEGVLFLQCQWHPSEPRTLGVTTSTGQTRLLRLGEDWTIRSWTDLGAIANSLEAWCLAFSPGRGEQVYAGGDDSVLRHTSWSPAETSTTTTTAPCTIVKGQHGAGVTAILPLDKCLRGPDGGRAVLTGSYDDHLRVLSIWDHELDPSSTEAETVAAPRRAELLADVNLGGGVWRLDLVDVRADADGNMRVRVLASCMYAGARLVELVEGSAGQAWECRVLARFEEHESMNYASDVVRRGHDGEAGDAGAGRAVRVVSTSFYDRLLCVWEYAGETSQ